MVMHINGVEAGRIDPVDRIALRIAISIRPIGIPERIGLQIVTSFRIVRAKAVVAKAGFFVVILPRQAQVKDAGPTVSGIDRRGRPKAKLFARQTF